MEELKPELINFLFSSPVIAWLTQLNEVAIVVHSNRKNTTQADVSVKKIKNYCLRTKPWMGTSFPNFPYVI